MTMPGPGAGAPVAIAPAPVTDSHVLDAALPPPADSMAASVAVEDDREHIREGDRVLLIIEDDLKFARIMTQMARE